MRRAIRIECARAGTIRVNASDVELYLLLGWTLTDVADCSGAARMIPPTMKEVVNCNTKDVPHGP